MLYVLCEGWSHEGEHIVGVYTTLEAAVARLEIERSKKSADEWSIYGCVPDSNKPPEVIG